MRGHASVGIGLLLTFGSALAAQAEPAKTQPDWAPPEPAAADERVGERRRMVRRQIAEPSARREPVKDPRVLEAMRAVPRHAFVPAGRRAQAYADRPLPIGEGQTISQPYVVAYMTAQLDIEPGDKVLEIGTGSGYQAAVLGHLTPHVHSIEILEPLAERARKALHTQGYEHVTVKRADGYHGWAEHAPFDAIIVTAAAAHLPPPLWKQLEPGGRLVMPLGGPYAVQRLIRMEKTEDGERRSRTLMTVRFVPMTGKALKGDREE
jgi:protein-L-isoaspartate(D-aspartate) O-methyltransferase